MKENDQKLLRTGLKRFGSIHKAEQDQRKKAIEDLAFANDESGQWEKGVKVKRDEAGRPTYTVNKVGPVVDQLVGDQRQNPTSIKVEPETSSDTDLAETMTGVISHIEHKSKAQVAYAGAYKEATECGYGGLRVNAVYASDLGFEQELRIEQIVSAASSLYFDRSATQPNKRDANYAFLITRMTKEDFKTRFPKAEVSSFTEGLGSNATGWFEEDMVRVAEYWFKEPETKELGLLSDGRVIDMKEEAAVLDELEANGITVEQTRMVEDYKVKMVLISGGELLTEVQDWDGKDIPLIPLFGKVTNIEGKELIRGIVRPAMDSQRLFNFFLSVIAEAAAMAPKDVFIVEGSQLEGYEDEWTSFNEKNPAALRYKNLPGVPPPSRVGATQISPALIQQLDQATRNIHASTGMEPASMGQVTSRLESGKAIEAQQKMGDRGSYVFQDNLKGVIEYLGEQLVDLIQKKYDTKRVLRITRPDGTSKTVTLNETVYDEDEGKDVIVNDLSLGTYSVKASTGPAFSTQRENSLNSLLSFFKFAPEELQTSMIDLVVQNMDIINNDEVRKRVRKFVLMSGGDEPTDEEIEEFNLGQGAEPDPMDKSLVNNVDAQTDEIIARTELKNVETLLKQVQAQGEAIKNLTKLMDGVQKAGELGLPISDEGAGLLESTAALAAELTETSIEEAVEVRNSNEQAGPESEAVGQQGAVLEEPVAVPEQVEMPHQEVRGPVASAAIPDQPGQ